MVTIESQGEKGEEGEEQRQSALTGLGKSQASSRKQQFHQMKKSQGCPADGIEGFRLFMIGQTDRPVEADAIPIEVMR